MSATAEAQTEMGTRNKEVKIVVLDNIANEGHEILESTPGVSYEVHTGLAGDDLAKVLNQFDGAVCRSGVKITGDVLQGNTHLKAIARAGVGTDNIDKPAATRQGIVVMNTPGGNTISTAEHTIALMLGLSRNIAPAHASLLDGKWDRKKFSGTQLHGKTLGIVGLGRIGQEVATRAKAFGMKVLGFDPFISELQAENLGVTLYKTVDEMLAHLDFLTVHTPLTEETKGLIGKEQIAKFKPNVRLVNCARGGIYDEEALIEGLRSGQLGGVALDVYSEEPCTDSPLFGMPGVLCTPHLGASTEEAQIQVAVEAVQLLINFLQKGEIRHAVNTIAIDPATLEKVRGYLDVAYRLGRFLAGWHGGAIEEVKLELQGDIASHDNKILKASFCAGLLEEIADNVTIVNAETIAADRGIKFETRSTTEQGAFSSVIAAEIGGGGEVLSAAGTLFGKNMPRIVRLRDYPTEAYMDGTLLIFTHRDIPGIIGNVGSVLAKEEVNIAQMAVGRASQSSGGQAVGVLNLDSSASESAIQSVLEIEGIESAKQITLPFKGELPSWLS
ncbi:MAG: phosphoglycerate dehydrogenase [Planctomycetota bacterium]